MPDPSTLLNDMRTDGRLFSVIDIINAFFSVPDIVICSESRQQLAEILERWRFTLKRRGMKVHVWERMGDEWSSQDTRSRGGEGAGL